MDLREVYLAKNGSDARSTGNIHESDIQFSSAILGNIGAPLDDGSHITDTFEFDEEEETRSVIVAENPLRAGILADAAKKQIARPSDPEPIRDRGEGPSTLV